MAYSFNVKSAFYPVSEVCNGTDEVVWASVSAVTIGDTIYENSGLTIPYNNGWYVLFSGDTYPYALSLMTPGYIHSISSWSCSPPNQFIIVSSYTLEDLCFATNYEYVYSIDANPTVGDYIFEDSALTQGWNNGFYFKFTGSTEIYAVSLTQAGYIHSLVDYTCTGSTLTLYKQPEVGKLSFCRSPVVYRFKNCFANRTYTFNLYIGDTLTPTLIYTTLNRKPDTQLGITIDVSNLLRNYIKSNLSYIYNNAVYFRASMLEYEGLRLLNTVYSDTGTAVLGYSDYSSGGTFNVTYTNDYLMNTMPQNTPYYIPNTGNNTYFLSYRPEVVDGYTIRYKTISGSNVVLSITLQPSTGWTMESRIIPIGFYNFKSGTTENLDVTKDITIDFEMCQTVLQSYRLSPQSCNGNEVLPIKFINKWGAWEIFFTQGRIDENLTVDYEIYKYNRVDYDTMTYNPKFGSYHKNFIQGKTKFSVNTGWLEDNKNVKLQELLLSEYVLINDLPYIIVDKEMKFKTNRLDKMVNYTLILERAYDVINNII